MAHVHRNLLTSNTSALSSSPVGAAQPHVPYVNSIDHLTCWYTNADTLTNKMTELKSRIELADKKPQIIIITEVRPKNSRYKLTEAELAIPGYDIHAPDLHSTSGRGNMIYTDQILKVRIEKIQADFDESTWIRIVLHDKEELILGCVYRSPQSGNNNNKILRDMVKEVCQIKCTHLLITGDFNYPNIDWNSWSTKGESTDSEEYMFIEALRDGYVYQHVTQATRGRGSNTPNLLDLVLTNEEDMVTNLEHQSPLGKSDHCMLVFDFEARTTSTSRTYRKYVL